MKKKNSTPTPHDATFRQFLTQPEIARDFMELHLPAELRAVCDLSTLKLESGSFVEDDLRQYFSDVLYSLKTAQGDDGYVHVLIEHQSSPDKHMAFRLLRYAVAAMQRHLEAGHKKLPLIIPVLFIPGNVVLILIPRAGWMNLPILRWPTGSIARLFRWWMSRLSLTRRLLSTAVWLR